MRYGLPKYTIVVITIGAALVVSAQGFHDINLAGYAFGSDGYVLGADAGNDLAFPGGLFATARWDRHFHAVVPGIVATIGGHDLGVPEIHGWVPHKATDEQGPGLVVQLIGRRKRL